MSSRAFGVMGATYKTWEVCMAFSIHSLMPLQWCRVAEMLVAHVGSWFGTWRKGLASFTSAWKVSLVFQLGLSRRL